MATDFTNEMLPGDNVNAPDSSFQQDISNNGNENPSEMAYTEPSEGAKQLKAIDDEIKLKF